MIRPPLTDRQIEQLAEGYPPGSPTLRVLDLEEALTSMAQELRQARAARRDERQAAIFVWAKAAFTVEQATSLPQRALRLLEEAVEAAQACGLAEDKAIDIVGFVYDRPAGDLAQELGGVGVTVLALAAAAGLSADAEEEREVSRVLAKPIEHFTARNAAKNAAGFLVVGAGEE